MATVPEAEKIDIGRVVSRGFAALQANFLPFAGLALLLSGLPTFLLQYLTLSGLEQAVATGDLAFALRPAFWVMALASGLVSLLVAALLQAMLVGATIRYLGGRDPALGKGVGDALRLILPLVALSIVSAVLIGVGFLLLIVPGFIAMTALMVAIAAMVEERRGVFDSMRRSRDLTRGSRGRIFILLILFWIISSILSALLAGFTSVATDTPAFAAAEPGAFHALAAAAGSAISTSLTTLIISVMVSALYVELRTVKEGARPEDLSAVFQ
jgi:hypothetical protein